MYTKIIVIFSVQLLLLQESLAACNGIRPGQPTVINGNAVTTVTAAPTCNGLGLSPPIQTTQFTPLVTEIVPSLQLGDITIGGDIPVGGSIKVSGCFPVYGLVSVDGSVPSCGSAVINTGGGVLTQLVEPPCRFY